VFVLRPSLGILESTKEHYVSETGCSLSGKVVGVTNSARSVRKS
jgi:hypothetical protein